MTVVRKQRLRKHLLIAMWISLPQLCNRLYSHVTFVAALFKTIFIDEIQQKQDLLCLKCTSLHSLGVLLFGFCDIHSIMSNRLNNNYDIIVDDIHHTPQTTGLFEWVSKAKRLKMLFRMAARLASIPVIST